MKPVYRFDGFIFASLIAGLILTIVPLPDAINAWRPAWPAMLVLYWTLHKPERFGLLGAWLVGIAMDTLTGTLLGQHALALCCVAFITVRVHLQMRVFPIPQLTITVLPILAIYQFLLFWINGVAGVAAPAVSYWGPVITGTLIWPLLYSLMSGVRYRVQLGN